MRTILFYDANSKDANLSKFVTDLIWGFETVAVNKENTIDVDRFYTPNTEKNGADVCLFVGCLPALSFCAENPNTKIYIFDVTFFVMDYTIYGNVIIPTQSTETLSKNYHQNVNLLIANSIVEPRHISNDVKIKAQELVYSYENYAQTYLKPLHLIEPKSIAIKNFVSNLSYNNRINGVNFLAAFCGNHLPTKFDGIAQSQVSEIKVSELFGESIITSHFSENMEAFSVLKINADGVLADSIDLFLFDFWVNNIKSTANNLSIVEYYTINQDKKVEVKIKHISTILSEIEIKLGTFLVDYIGTENYNILNRYISSKYPEREVYFNYDGSKSLEATLTEFFV